MAKKLFFVAFLLVLAIVSVDLFVNVSADPQDLVQGMMEGSAHLAKGVVDTALAGGQMMEGMVGKGLHPFGHGPFGHGPFGKDSAEGPDSESGSGGSSGGMGGSGGGIGPGLLRR